MAKMKLCISVHSAII